jgi:phosphatidylinositol-3-phosphatase
MASKAYKSNGLIVITADEAPSSGEFGDSSSCCGQPAYPNLTTSGLRHGGGVVGALLLSPLIKGGTTSQEPYNHYSLLRTVEDVFGLSHLGYAALPAVTAFNASLLNATAKG